MWIPRAASTSGSLGVAAVMPVKRSIEKRESIVAGIPLRRIRLTNSGVIVPYP